MNNLQNFYERVQKCAQSKNTTVEAVYTDAGFTKNSYYGPKRIGKFLRADGVVKIADILETTVEFLVTGNEPFHDKKYLYKFLDNLEKIIKEKKEEVK